MNFTHLTAFFSVARTGSVTAASERLHVSQPALTREIRDLEERLGVLLFDRLPRGMKPTEAGRMLAEYAAKIFQLADAAEHAIGEFTGLTRGRLGIATCRTIGDYLLPAVLHEYRKLYPSIAVDVAVSNTGQVEEAVLSYNQQIGLVEGPYDARLFDAIVVGRDELIAVASPSHSLAGMHSLTADDVANAGLVMHETGSGTRSIIEEAYGQRSLELSPKLSVASAEAIKQLLRIGGAVAWISRHSVAEELASGTLVQLTVVDLKIERDLNMIWPKARGLSPSARAFHWLASRMLDSSLEKAAA